jgi:hypothetical protein
VPWDIAGAFDNLTYQLWLSAASILWQPHVTMVAVAHTFSRLAATLTAGVLPLILSFVTAYIRQSNLYATAAALAVALAALGLAASYLDLRMIDLRQFITYAVLAGLVLSQGPALMTDVEGARREVAAAVYERAYATVKGDTLAGAFSAAPMPSEPWAQFDLVDYDPVGYSALDVALSALEASPAEAMLPGLPSGFAAAFFPHGSITDLDAARRADAIQTGWQGVMRLLLAYPLSIVAVIEGLMEVVFSAAGMILLAALPLALVFGFFLPTEAIVTRLLRQYTMFFVNYVVVSMLAAVGVSGLVAAATRRSLTMMAAGAVLSALFYFFGVRVAVRALQSSFTAFTGSVAQTLNVEGPGRAVRRGLSTAVGLAGAGLAIAGGAPLLAPAVLRAGRSFTEGDDGRESAGSLARTGLRLAGSSLMRRSSLARLDPGAEGMMHELVDADADTVRLAARRFSRVQGRTPADGGTGAGHVNEDRVLHRSGQETIAAAGERYGPEWLEEVSGAVEDVVGEMRDRGLESREIVERFGNRDAIALASHGGRKVLAALGDGTRGTLRDPLARQALRAVMDHRVTRRGGPRGTGLHEPEWSLDTTTEIETAVACYGADWDTQVSQAIDETLEGMRRRGVSSGDIPYRFVDRRGDVVLSSEGGRAVIGRLNRRVRESMEEPQGRSAVLGMVAERVMPRTEIGRQDITDAIADVVDAGAARGGADAVARRLNVVPEALGSAYGPITSLLRRAEEQGLSGEDIRRTRFGPAAHDHGTGNWVQALVKRMPDRIPVRRSHLDPRARREGGEGHEA